MVGPPTPGSVRPVRSFPSMTSPTPSTTPAAPSLPELPVHLTRFVGRARELDDLEGLVGSARLVTLTGAGGVNLTFADRYLECASSHRGTGAAGGASTASLESLRRQCSMAAYVKSAPR